jgi:3-hydroxyacyl-[acyl-carrier-protein] dehydratase
MSSKQMIYNIEDIMRMIPHRYPMLLVDRVLEVKSGEYAIALKNVTINEPFFQGHFPGKPIMPGVLIVEALAQTSAVFVAASQGKTEDKLVYFMSIESANFRKPVVPGDSMKMRVEKMRKLGNVWRMKGEVEVEGVKVADAVFSAMMIDRDQNTGGVNE